MSDSKSTFVGADIGYGYTKFAIGAKLGIIPSIVGSPDRSVFSLGQTSTIIEYTDHRYMIGSDAVRQSQFQARREDRDWIHSPEYQTLFYAVLAQASPTPTIVTGLPLAWYQSDKNILKANLSRYHEFTVDNGHGMTEYAVTPKVVYIVPQPFGAFFAEVFNALGGLKEPTLLDGRCGIIDVGSKTTNILTVEGGSDIPGRSQTVIKGGWDVARAVARHLEEVAPELDPSDYQLQAAIQSRTITYYSQPIDLTATIAGAVQGFADNISATATQLWGSGADLDAIILSGGGMYLLSDALRGLFSRHGRVITPDKPEYANAIGFARFAKFKEQTGG